jgi:hypothetical protein
MCWGGPLDGQFVSGPNHYVMAVDTTKPLVAAEVDGHYWPALEQVKYHRERFGVRHWSGDPWFEADAWIPTNGRATAHERILGGLRLLVALTFWR